MKIYNNVLTNINTVHNKYKLYKNINQEDVCCNLKDKTKILSIYDQRYRGLYFQGIEKIGCIKKSKSFKRIEGCIFGGAIGDAFGAPVEAYSVERIQKRFGISGIRYIPKKNGVYKVTDDTQMTLFTMEGLLKSYIKNCKLDEEPNYDIIYSSYINWYNTQSKSFDILGRQKGLLSDSALYSNRGPGHTCLSSLRDNIMGSIEKPINDSAGNGGLMRVAPVGIMYNKNPELAFEIGINCAALTHGSPEAYLPAGFQCALIANLFNNIDLETSINNAMRILQKYENSEDTCECLKKAINLSKNKEIKPLDAINQLGMGYTGSECLAIALYCTLKNADNFKKALTMAVNHPGDSDTTGAVTGNIMGAYLGSDKIPRGWLENIEYIKWLNSYSESLYEILNANNSANYTSNEHTSIFDRWDSDKFS